MARQPGHAPGASSATSPIATAYFRAAEDEAGATPEGAPAGSAKTGWPHNATDASAGGDDDIPAAIEAVIGLLAEAGVMPARPRALLEAAARTLASRDSWFCGG